MVTNHIKDVEWLLKKKKKKTYQQLRRILPEAGFKLGSLLNAVLALEYMYIPCKDRKRLSSGY